MWWPTNHKIYILTLASSCALRCRSVITPDNILSVRRACFRAGDEPLALMLLVPAARMIIYHWPMRHSAPHPLGAPPGMTYDPAGASDSYSEQKFCRFFLLWKSADTSSDPMDLRVGVLLRRG